MICDSEIAEFQPRIVHERLVRGISQTELARQIGITQAHLSYIEHGERELTKERYLLIREYFDEIDRM